MYLNRNRNFVQNITVTSSSPPSFTITPKCRIRDVPYPEVGLLGPMACVTGQPPKRGEGVIKDANCTLSPGKLSQFNRQAVEVKCI